MTTTSPAEHQPDQVERPSRAAQLKIKAEPARLKVIARRWLTAEGTVPPADARHLISTFGIVGCVVTGCAAAVLTMHAGSGLTPVAFAELAVAITAAILIVVCGFVQRGSGRQQEDQPGRAADGAPRETGDG
jgi:hypothetical protein